MSSFENPTALGTGTVVYDSEDGFSAYMLGEERRLTRIAPETGKQTEICWLLLDSDGRRVQFNLLDVLISRDEIGPDSRYRLATGEA